MRNNKYQYALIIAPLIIIGFYLTHYFPASKPYAILVLILYSFFSGWKDVKKANGEEEISRILVPMILLTVFIVIGIISFIF